MNSSTMALIRQIVAHVKCSVCGHHFGVSDIQLVGRREQVWALRAQCRECRAKALILALVNEKGTRSIYTDLVPEEWERFKMAPPISFNDIIHLHEFLDSYKGDLSDILEDPLPAE